MTNNSPLGRSNPRGDIQNLLEKIALAQTESKEVPLVVLELEGGEVQLLKMLLEAAAENNLRPLITDGLTLDFQGRTVQRDGKPIPLSPTEFRILACLAKNPGVVISSVDILCLVQNYYTYSEKEAQEIVKVCIRRIRQKIERDSTHPSIILNVRGFGYKFSTQGDAN